MQCAQTYEVIFLIDKEIYLSRDKTKIQEEKY